MSDDLPYFYFYCDCGKTCMRTVPPGPDAELVICTFECPWCATRLKAVPAAWDQR